MNQPYTKNVRFLKHGKERSAGCVWKLLRLVSVTNISFSNLESVQWTKWMWGEIWIVILDKEKLLYAAIYLLQCLHFHYWKQKEVLLYHTSSASHALHHTTYWAFEEGNWVRSIMEVCHIGLAWTLVREMSERIARELINDKLNGHK